MAFHDRSKSAPSKAAEGLGLAFGCTLTFVLTMSVIFWIAAIGQFEFAGKNALEVGRYYLLLAFSLTLSSYVSYLVVFSVVFPLLYKARLKRGSGPLKFAFPVALASVSVFLVWSLLFLVLIWWIDGEFGDELSERVHYLAVAGLVLIVVTVPTSIWFLRRFNADLREVVLQKTNGNGYRHRE